MDKRKEDQSQAEELRRKAVEGLRFEEPLPEEISPAAVQKLIHELRVHQIELEMQNDELRQAQEILEESRSRYSDLYDFAPIGHLTLDELGIIKEANLTASRQLQMERTRLIDRQFTHFLVMADTGAFRRHLNLVLKGRERQAVELRLKREGGEEVFILLESVFHQDTAGKSLVRTALSDISKRRQAEAGLQIQQEELQIILDTVPAMIFYKDKENRFIRTNKILAEAMGLPRKELDGKSVFDLYPSKADDYWQDDLEVMRSGNPKRNIIETLDTPEGVRWVQTDKIPYRDAQGNIIGVIGFAIDITERKRAEEALKDSEERFRAMANAIPQLAWIARSDGYIVWYNQRWHDYTGTTPEEMEGWGWQSVHDPEVLPQVLKRWRASISTGRPFDMVLPLRQGDGQFRQFLTRVMPMKDADGQVIQWFGTNTDITESKLAEEALQWAHSEMEERVRERTADLRQTVEQLQWEIEARQQTEEALKESEQRLRYLTSQLLSAQEAERGRLALELHDDLGQSLMVLKMQLRAIQRKAPPESSAISESLESPLNFVNEIIERIRRLSRNLRPAILEELGLTAAIHHLFEELSRQDIHVTMDLDDTQGLFSQEAQINIFRICQESFTNITRYAQANQVSVSIKRQEGSVAFQVKDNGRGFDLQKVISVNITDRGLGLTAMDERARMLGGSLTIRSQEDQGTKITLNVPIQGQ